MKINWRFCSESICWGLVLLTPDFLVPSAQSQIDPSITLDSSFEEIIGLNRGKYQGRMFSSEGAHFSKVIAGDIDEDGDVDAVGLGNPLTLFWNSGSGSLRYVTHLEINDIYIINDGALADFNGDSHPDIAALNYVGMLTIYLGTEDRNFEGPFGTDLIPNAQRIFVGDANGDMMDDFVGFSYDHFAQYLSNGDGSFTQQPEIEITPANWQALALGDVTGDQIEDVIWSVVTDSIIRILPGTGEGSFGEVVELNAGGSSRALAISDMDSDSRPDLLVGGAAGTVQVFMNQGQESFAEPETIFEDITGAVTSIELLDINNDGDREIVVQLSNGFSRNRIVSLIPGENGEYTDQILFEDEFYLPGVLADFTGDGQTDVVFAATAYDIYLSEGRNGSFYNSISRLGISNTRFGGFDPALREHLATGDVDGNGFQDIANQRGSLLLNQGDGGFLEVSLHGEDLMESNLLRTLATDVALGDLDKDDDLDVMISVSSNRNQEADFLRVFLQDANHQFPGYSDYPTGATPVNLIAFDVDGDENMDAVTLNVVPGGASSVSVLYGDGTGAFAAPMDLLLFEQTSGSTPERIAVGNVSGDGLPDILVVDRIFSGAGSHLARILENSGNRGFIIREPQTLSEEGRYFALSAIADFNLDGWLDIVSPQYVGNESMLVTLLSNGSGQFVEAFSVTLPSVNARSYKYVAAHEIDRAYGPDVLLVYDSGIDVLFSRPRGGFFELESFFFTPLTGFVATGDLNNDDWPELIVEDGLELAVRPNETANDDLFVFRIAAIELGNTTEVTRVLSLFEPYAEELEEIVLVELGPSWFDRFLAWLEQFLSPAITVLNGEPTDFIITREMADEANALIDDIRDHASPELASLLDDEREKVNNLEDFVGMTPSEFVERLDLEEGIQILRSAFEQGAFRLEVNLSVLDDLILEKTRSLFPADWLPVDNAKKEQTGDRFYLIDPSPQESTGFYRVVQENQ